MVLGLLVAGAFVVVGVVGRPRPVDRGVVPGASAASIPTVASGGRPAVGASPTGGTSAGSRSVLPSTSAGSLPAGLDIAQLAVHAPVVPVSVGSGGALVVPDDVDTVGWWVGGALPGAASGTVVLDGHVDSKAMGEGALFHLRDLRVGATVVVTGSPVEVRYRITGLREYDKGTLPAASLFAQTGTPRLVLITCGGPFDAATRHYRDNVVAFGVPAT